MKILRILLLAALLPTGAFAAKPAAPRAPNEVVDRFQAALIQNMHDGSASASCNARVAKLGSAIHASFDVPAIARQVLRRHWSTLTPEQQKQFTAVLDELVVTTYAQEFGKFGGESFSPSQADGAAKQQTVTSQLLHAPDTPVNFKYLLRDTPTGWRIVNIIAEGVSDLAVRSAQYGRTLDAQGFDALIAGINKQIADYRQGC